MKILLLFIASLISIPVFSQKESLNCDIYKIQIDTCGYKEYLKDLKYNRLEALWLDRISSSRNDTIYIVEKFSHEVDIARKYFIGSMWIKSDAEYRPNTISLHFDTYYLEYGKMEKSKDLYFSPYIIYLVNEWNLEQIKKEEAESKLINPQIILATRVITGREGCVQIDFVYFEEFANMDMDAKYDSIVTPE